MDAHAYMYAYYKLPYMINAIDTSNSYKVNRGGEKKIKKKTTRTFYETYNCS